MTLQDSARCGASLLIGGPPLRGGQTRAATAHIPEAKRAADPPKTGTNRFKVENKKKGEELRPFPFHERKTCGSTAVLAACWSAHGGRAGDRQRLGGFELLGLLEFLCHDFVSSVFWSARCGRTLHNMHVTGHGFQRKNKLAMWLEIRGMRKMARILKQCHGLLGLI